MYRLEINHSFDAAHFLAGHEGKCGNIHGHRWKVYLAIKSEKLVESGTERGMCVDFAKLKEDLKEKVDFFDHAFIIEKGSLKEKTMQALKEEEFRIVEMDFRPTAENFAKYFFDEMKSMGYDVEEVKVFETPNNCAAYFE